MMSSGRKLRAPKEIMDAIAEGSPFDITVLHELLAEFTWSHEDAIDAEFGPPYWWLCETKNDRSIFKLGHTTKNSSPPAAAAHISSRSCSPPSSDDETPFVQLYNSLRESLNRDMLSRVFPPQQYRRHGIFAKLWECLPDALDTLFSSGFSVPVHVFDEFGGSSLFFDLSQLNNSSSNSNSTDALEQQVFKSVKEVIECALTSGEVPTVCYTSQEVSTPEAQQEICAVIEHVLPLFTDVCGRSADVGSTDLGFGDNGDISDGLGDFMSESEDEDSQTVSKTQRPLSNVGHHFPRGAWVWDFFSAL